MASAPAMAADTPVISIAGTWQFKLDPASVGEAQKWYNEVLPETVKLPGTLDQNGKGTPASENLDINDPKVLQGLRPLLTYVGAAWYQSTIQIPQNWEGKYIALFLERSHCDVSVWVDEVKIGSVITLVSSTEMPLGRLKPGAHRLTIRVNNKPPYPSSWNTHALDMPGNTMGNWNGIVGRMELTAHEGLLIRDIQVYPKLSPASVRLVVKVENLEPQKSTGKLRIEIKDPQGAPVGKLFETSIEALSGEQTHTCTLPIDNPQLWDEFSTGVYTLKASLERANKPIDPPFITKFGLREFNVTGSTLNINGRGAFLRGNNNCGEFPLTGYAPADLESWRRILGIYKEYGLNHVRFHSWCPPEAAFVAADEVGMYLQPEVGFLGTIDNPADIDIMEREARRVLRQFGNHPSFTMMSMGNELRIMENANRDVFLKMEGLLKTLMQEDPRRIFTGTTGHYVENNFRDKIPQVSQFAVAHVRGVSGPGTDKDRRLQNATYPVPVISHEIGQWAVFPDLSDAELRKYDQAVMKPTNLVALRERLRRNGLIELAPVYHKNTGKLAVELYKDEIETLLRTPGHGGFQLLQLHDYPGQSTAQVGILNAFHDSKGLVSGPEFRQFCGPVVPLIRMPKRVYRTNETFQASIDVAQYGPGDLKAAVVGWELWDASSKRVAGGELTPSNLRAGMLNEKIGVIDFPLLTVAAPAKITVRVFIKGTEYHNAWNIWVYPPTPTQTPNGILVKNAWDEETRRTLAQGGKVLFLASDENLQKQFPGKFLPSFWSPAYFKDRQQSMGILLDPAHPAFKLFPTDAYTDWQWHGILEKSFFMDIEKLPLVSSPLIRIIDGYNLNRKLALAFEARVGKGKLIVCSANLSDQMDGSIESGQLHQSIIAYMQSAVFQPALNLEPELLTKEFFTKPRPVLSRNQPVIVSSAAGDFNGSKANDGQRSTRWCANGPSYPQWWQVDLGEMRELDGCKIVWEASGKRRFLVEGSADGNAWSTLVDKTNDTEKAAEIHALDFKAQPRARFVRVSIQGGDGWAGFRECEVLGPPQD
ncbi:MAG: discoidin domain-containing protein [Verrucomicrobia bacterium]|nr:discoidin domain-containing protein [Verrucomicrobiota bacterium]